MYARHTVVGTLFAISMCTVLLSAVAAAEPLHRVAAIQLPGQPLKSFDIGFADADTYALADRSNASVDLIDTRSLRYVGRVGGFAGDKPGHLGGPNGVVIVDGHQIWAGDGDGSVKVVDLTTKKIVASVSTGGHRRVDELASDPRDHLVITANNADRPPFLTLISTPAPHAIAGHIRLDRATGGLEQPIWDPRTGRVYVAIPQLDGIRSRGGIAVIDPHAGKLLTIWQVSQCLPAGLALGPGHQLLVGCSDDAIAAGFPAKSIVFDTENGKPLKTFDQVGGSDEVWYDRRSHDYLLASAAEPGGPVLGVIDAALSRWRANVPTGKKAHSVAAAPMGGDVFVPVAAGDPQCRRGCVEVFGR